MKGGVDSEDRFSIIGGGYLVVPFAYYYSKNNPGKGSSAVWSAKRA